VTGNAVKLAPPILAADFAQNGLLMADRIASVRCDPQVRESRFAETQSLFIDPVVDVLAGRVLIKAVAFLDFAFKLFALAVERRRAPRRIRKER
jgi:hypothetical protein